MSANGLHNEAEDAEIPECDGDKVVTMMDVLQEQQEFEDDANAVLGASDEKNCTYSKGYIKRQAIYACLTCCAEAKTNPSMRAGVCLACSLTCHEDHELIELYTKRNFRCDCGNPKFNSHPCQFTPNKRELNEENCYNQNFSGVYCVCHKPYPDPEVTEEDEMIQCIICEDWLHSSHLNATVPGADLYSEMVCKSCMEKNVFLHDYSNIAVNSEPVDVDVTSINESTLDSGTSACNGDSVIAESSNIADETPLIDAENNDAPLTTNGNMEPIIMSVEGNITMDEQNKDNNATNIEMAEINKETFNGDVSIDSKETKDLSQEVLKDDSVEPNIVSRVTESTDKNLSEEVAKDDQINTENLSEAIESTNKGESDQNSENVNEITAGCDNNEDAGMQTSDNIETQITESTNEENSASVVNQLEDNNDHQVSEKTDEETNKKVVEQSDAIITSSVEGPAPDIIDKVPDEVIPTFTDDEKEMNGVTNGEEETLSSDKTVAANVIPVTELLFNNVNKTGEANEQKRKLSTEDADEGIMKKPKLDEPSDCKRPRGVKKVFKGATFWPSNFRQKLCTCNDCLSMYKDLSVLFLTDLDDTVSAYEMLGKERVEGTPLTQYEKGLEALSSLDRIQQINALTEYNNMRDKLLDFLKSFKDRKEVVKEEDIKEFFAGMKPKREPDGVYFCR